MTVYMIWDSQSHKYVSLASKHRKHYCTKQNAMNAINNSGFSNKDELEVHEYELVPTDITPVNKLEIGTKIRYHKYMAKDRNGICIYTNLSENPEEKVITEAYYIEDDQRIYLESGEGIIKPLYKEVIQEGTGFIIDHRPLAVSEMLFFDTAENCLGAEYYYVTKGAFTFCDCVRVCYAKGKTRWVPVDSMLKE